MSRRRYYYPKALFTSPRIRSQEMSSTRCGIAYERVDETSVKFSITVLSPRDQFSRPVARTKLNVRLDNAPINISVLPDSNEDSLREQIVRYINENTSNLRYVPQSFTSFVVTQSAN